MADAVASIQLIVFGERNSSDLPGVLKEIAAAGFPAIEAGNLYASHGADAVNKLLSENNLQISGAHFGYGDYADLEKLTANIAYGKTAGVTNFMCSGVADGKTLEGYRESAKVFNEAGKRLSDAGIQFNYHNHDWEFKDLEGGRGMDVLASETDPAFVKFNIDVFWLYYAGVNPAKYILAHADRMGYFHFKDGIRRVNLAGENRPDFKELGRGEVDLQAAYAAAKQTGARWIVSEQDRTELTPMESAAISRSYLKSTLGI